MKDERSVSNAPDTVSNSEDQNKVKSEGAKVEKNDDMVSYESHKKLLSQLKNTKELNEQLARKLNSFEQEQRRAEETKLQEKGEYQKLLEIRQKEIEELNAKLGQTAQEKEQTAKALEDTWKLQAFYDKLPGRIKRREYLSFADLDKIALDPDKGEVDSKSLDLVVNDFLENHGDLVDTKSFRSLPSESASNLSIDPKNFRNLPLKEMRSKLKEAVKIAKQQQGVK